MIFRYNALQTDSGWAAPPFFFTFTIFAVFITLNYLVVIIMGQFSMKPDEKLKKNKARAMERRNKIRSNIIKKQNSKADKVKRKASVTSSGNNSNVMVVPTDNHMSDDDDDDVCQEAEEAAAATTDQQQQQQQQQCRQPVTCWEKFWIVADDVPAAPGAEKAEGEQRTTTTTTTTTSSKLWHQKGCLSSRFAMTSLGFISPDNRLRKHIQNIVNSNWFEGGIILAIVVSSITLTLESPLYKDDDQLQLFLVVCDYFFTIVFLIEALLKILAMGLFFPYDAYLSDGWNKLDFVVVIVSVMGLGGGGGGAGGVGKILRVGRILRPLRMINRNEGMKVIVDALLRSLPAVGYTVILLAVYLFLFAVLGLNSFSGKFYRCNDGSVVTREQCRGIYENEQGVTVPRVWSNPPYSFDNIFKGMLTLCSVITLRGWLDVVYSAMDVTEDGLQPQRDHSSGHALFFVLFMFIGAFFMLKIFVGIIVDNFRQFSGTALLTESQIRWLATKRMMQGVRLQKTPPKHCLRKLCHDITTNQYFEGFITVCILFHIVVLATQSPQQSSLQTFVLVIIHWMVTGVYSLEFVLRVVAQSPLGYFYTSDAWCWNLYDAVIVSFMYIMPLSLGTYQGVGVSHVWYFSSTNTVVPFKLPTGRLI